jgi:TonB family protein
LGASRLRSSISISIVLHAAFFGAWTIVLGQRAALRIGGATGVQREPVAVDIISKVVDSQPEKRRIVQTEKGDNTKAPRADAFFGERTQAVDRETVSRKQEVSPGAGPAMKNSARRTAPMTAARGATRPLLSSLGVPVYRRARTPSQEMLEQKLPDRPNWASEGGGTEVPSDYIKGLAESERTALNTREYMFFGYFQRIRNRLDVAWGATLRSRLEKLYRKGRRIASEREFKTRTWVTLDGMGSVVRVRLLEESGVFDLDDAAVAAFNDAGPFPNPPKGLMDPRGQVEIHWDFVLRN